MRALHYREKFERADAVFKINEAVRFETNNIYLLNHLVLLNRASISDLFRTYMSH